MNRQKTILVIIVIISTIVYLSIKSVKNSIVLKRTGRLNIMVYSQVPAYYSLSVDNVDYMIPFQADYELVVPGGYGQYRVGALGKLAYLEKKPNIISKTFSAATSSFVDIYFYPDNAKIYYGSDYQPKLIPSINDIFLNKSNGNWIDRLFVFYMFFSIDKNKYKLISDLPVTKNGNRLIFDREVFFKKYQGSLYDKNLRQQADTVQIKYAESYQTALLISQILEGQGIRVVDIKEEREKNSCNLIYKGKQDLAAKNIAYHLNCLEEKNNTDISDIILTLGNLEDDWAVK